MKDELHTLRALRREYFESTEDHESMEKQVMKKYENFRQGPVFGVSRRLAALFVAVFVGGAAFGAGIERVISEWLVTVEKVDGNQDRVTLESTHDSELGFTSVIPNEDTADLVEAAENNKLGVFELEGGEVLFLRELKGEPKTAELEVLDGTGESTTAKIPDPDQ